MMKLDLCIISQTEFLRVSSHYGKKVNFAGLSFFGSLFVLCQVLGMLNGCKLWFPDCR